MLDFLVERYITTLAHLLDILFQPYNHTNKLLIELYTILLYTIVECHLGGHLSLRYLDELNDFEYSSHLLAEKVQIIVSLSTVASA